jgi:hypothetical protein
VNSSSEARSTIGAYLASNTAGYLLGGALPLLLQILVLGRYSTGFLAICTFAGGVVRLVGTPLLAPLVDRHGSARLLVVTDLAALLAGLLLLLAMSLGIDGRLAWLAYFVTLGVVSALAAPAEALFLQDLVPVAKLGDIISFDSAAMTAARFVGPMICGTTLLWLRPERSFATFTACGFLLLVTHAWIIRRTGVGARIAGQVRASTGIQAWYEDVCEGFLIRLRLRTEACLLVHAALELAVVIPTFGIMLPILVQRAGWPFAWVGWIEGTAGLGLLIGSLGATPLARRIDEWTLAQVAGLGLALAFGAAAWAVHARLPIMVAGALAVAHGCLGLRMFCGRARRRVAIPKRVLGRFVAAFASIAAISGQLGVVAAATVTPIIGVEGWFVASGITTLALTLWLRSIPSWRELLTVPIEEADEFYVRRHPKIFQVSSVVT